MGLENCTKRKNCENSLRHLRQPVPVGCPLPRFVVVTGPSQGDHSPSQALGPTSAGLAPELAEFWPLWGGEGSGAIRRSRLRPRRTPLSQKKPNPLLQQLSHTLRLGSPGRGASVNSAMGAFCFAAAAAKCSRALCPLEADAPMKWTGSCETCKSHVLPDHISFSKQCKHDMDHAGTGDLQR